MQKDIFFIADDYGIHPAIDDAVDIAISKGLVQGVAIIPNINKDGSLSAYTRDRLQQLHHQFGKGVKIGLHFNISNGYAAAGMSSLTQQNGKFLTAFKQHHARIQQHDLEQELRAQIACVTDVGICMDHFSDHFGLVSNFDSHCLNTMLKVISLYQKEVGKKVLFRNPVTTSFVFNKHCLANSHMKRLSQLGELAKSMVIGVQTRQFIKRAYTKKELNKKLQIVKDAGIFFPDYTIDKLYAESHWERILQCIAKAPLHEPYLVSNPMYPHQVQTEIILHIARKASQQELEAAQKFGFMKTYFKYGRVREFMQLQRNASLIKKLANS